MPSGRRRAPRAIGALAVVAIAAGCTGGSAADGASGRPRPTTSTSTIGREWPPGFGPTPATFAREEADTVLTVSLRNYVVLGVPSRVAGPDVWFAATVVGGRRHELEVVDAAGDPVGAIDPFTADEGEQALALSLPPGTYRIHCLVRNGTRTHASMGMRQDLVVD